jgi:hypothetical protein
MLPISSGSLTYGNHFTPVQLITKRGFGNVAARRGATVHMHIRDLKMCTGHISAGLSYRLYFWWSQWQSRCQPPHGIGDRIGRGADVTVAHRRGWPVVGRLRPHVTANNEAERILLDKALATFPLLILFSHYPYPLDLVFRRWVMSRHPEFRVPTRFCHGAAGACTTLV